jgi:multiple sugar transport system substrate-binding protein
MIGSCRCRSAKWGRWLALALVGATSFGGVLGAASATAQETASFRFAFWGDPAEQAAYEQVIAGFEAAHPDIDVEVDYTPGQSDFQRKVSTDFAGGDPPDLFLINYRQFGQYAARGALEPIGPYLEASETISADEYATVPMDAFKYRGAEQVCMPQNVSSLVVYYNVDLFNANGVPLPTDGWTWDEFIAAAETLTQDTDGDGTTDLYGVAVEPIMYRFVSFIWSAGGEVVDDLDNPTRLTLDTPEAIDGIEKFISLGVTGHNVVPSEEEVAAEDDGTRFMRGGAAMFLQSRREVPTLREIEGFTWDVAPLPTINEPATVLHSDAFCMAAAAEEKDAVWDFIEYAVGEEGQLILAETGRIVPARNSVAASDVFLEGVPIDAGSATTTEAKPPASSQVFIDNIAHMHRLPSLSTWPEVEDAFNAEFDRSFYEEIDVEAAIAAASANAKEAFDRAAAEDQAV